MSNQLVFDDELGDLSTPVNPALNFGPINDRDSILNDPVAPVSMMGHPLPLGHCPTKFKGNLLKKMVGRLDTTFSNHTLLDFPDLVHTNIFDNLRNEFGKLEMSFITEELLNTTLIAPLSESNFINGQGNLIFGPIVYRAKIPMVAKSATKDGEINFKVTMEGLKTGYDFIMMGNWHDYNHPFHSNPIPTSNYGYGMNAHNQPIIATAYSGKAFNAFTNLEVDFPTNASGVEVQITPAVTIPKGNLQFPPFPVQLLGYAPPEITDELSIALNENPAPFSAMFYNLLNPDGDKTLRIGRYYNGITTDFGNLRDRIVLGESLASQTATNNLTLKYIYGQAELTLEKLEISGGHILAHFVAEDTDNDSVDLSNFAPLMHDGGTGGVGTSASAATLYITEHTGSTGWADGFYKVDHTLAVAISTAASTFGKTGGSNAPKLVVRLLDTAGNSLISTVTAVNGTAATTQHENGKANLSPNPISNTYGMNTHWNFPPSCQTGTNPFTGSPRVLNSTNFSTIAIPKQPPITLLQYTAQVPDLTTTLTYETYDRPAENVLTSDQVIVETEPLSDVVARNGIAPNLCVVKKGSLLYPNENIPNAIDTNVKDWVEQPANDAGAATDETGLFGDSVGVDDAICKDMVVSLPVDATITYTNKYTGVRTNKSIVLIVDLFNPTSTTITWNDYLQSTGGRGAYDWNGAAGTDQVGASKTPSGVLDLYLLNPVTLEDAKIGGNVEMLPVQDQITVSLAAGWGPLSKQVSGPGAGAPLSLTLGNINFLALFVKVNSKISASPAQVKYITTSGKILQNGLVDVNEVINKTSSPYHPSNHGLPINPIRKGLDGWVALGKVNPIVNKWNSDLLNSDLATAGIAAMSNAGSPQLYMGRVLNGIMKAPTPVLTAEKINLLQNTIIYLTDISNFTAVSTNNDSLVFALKVISSSESSNTVLQDGNSQDLVAPTYIIKTGPFFRNNTGAILSGNTPQILSVEVVDRGNRGNADIAASRFVIDNATPAVWTAQGVTINMTSILTGLNDTEVNGGRAGIATAVPSTSLYSSISWTPIPAEIEFNSDKINTLSSNKVGVTNFGQMTGNTSQSAVTYAAVVGSGHRNFWPPASGYTIWAPLSEANFSGLGSPFVTKSPLEIVGTPLLSIEPGPIEFSPPGLLVKINSALTSILQNLNSKTNANIIEILMPRVSININQSEAGTTAKGVGAEGVKSALAPASSVLTNAELMLISEYPDRAGACFKHCKVIDKITSGVVEFTLELLVVAEIANANITNYDAIKAFDADNVTFTSVNIDAQDVQALMSVGFIPVPVDPTATPLKCNVMFRVQITEVEGTFSNPDTGNPLEMDFNGIISGGFFNSNACLKLSTDRIRIKSLKSLEEIMFTNLIEGGQNGRVLLKKFLTLPNETTLVLGTYNDANSILEYGNPSIVLQIQNLLSESQADEIANAIDPFQALENIVPTPGAVLGISADSPGSYFQIEMKFLQNSDSQVLFNGPSNTNLYTSLSAWDLDSTVQIGSGASARLAWKDAGIVFARDVLNSDGLYEQIKIEVPDNLVSSPRLFTGSELQISEDQAIPELTPSATDYQLQVSPALKTKAKYEILNTGFGFKLTDSLQIPVGGRWVQFGIALTKIIQSTVNTSLYHTVEDEIADRIEGYLQTAAQNISSTYTADDALVLGGTYTTEIVVGGSNTSTNFGIQFDASIVPGVGANAYTVSVTNVEVILTNKGQLGDKKLGSTGTDLVILQRESFIKVGSGAIYDKLQTLGATSISLGNITDLTHAADSPALWIGQRPKPYDSSNPNICTALFPPIFGAPSAIDIRSDTMGPTANDQLSVSLDSKTPELPDDVRISLTVTSDMLSSNSSSELSTKHATIGEQIDDISLIVHNLCNSDELSILKSSVSNLIVPKYGVSPSNNDFVIHNGKPYYTNIIKASFPTERICDFELDELKDFDGITVPLRDCFKEKHIPTLVEILQLFVLRFYTLSNTDELLLKDVNLNKNLTDISKLTEDLMEKPLTYQPSVTNFINYRSEIYEKSLLEAIIDREPDNHLVKQLIEDNKQHLLISPVTTFKDYGRRMLGHVQKLSTAQERQASTAERGKSLLGDYEATEDVLLLKRNPAIMLALALKDLPSLSSVEKLYLSNILGKSVSMLSNLSFIELNEIVETTSIEIEATPVLEVCYSDIASDIMSLKRTIPFSEIDNYNIPLWLEPQITPNITHILPNITPETILSNIREKLGLSEEISLDFEKVELKLKFTRCRLQSRPVNLWRHFSADIEIIGKITAPIAIGAQALRAIEGSEAKKNNIGGYAEFYFPLTISRTLSESRLQGKTLTLEFEMHSTNNPVVRFKKTIVFDPHYPMSTGSIDVGFQEDNKVRVNPAMLLNPSNSIKLLAFMEYSLRLTASLESFCNSETMRMIQSTSTLKASTEVTSPITTVVCQVPVASTIVSKSPDQVGLTLGNAPSLKQLLDDGSLNDDERHITFGVLDPSEHKNIILAAISFPLAGVTHKSAEVFAYTYELDSPYGGKDYLLIAETSGNISGNSSRIAALKDASGNLVSIRPEEDNYLESTLQIGISTLAQKVKGLVPGSYQVFRKANENDLARVRETMTAAAYQALYSPHNAFMAPDSLDAVTPNNLGNLRAVSKADSLSVYLAIESANESSILGDMQTSVLMGVNHNVQTQSGVSQSMQQTVVSSSFKPNQNQNSTLFLPTTSTTVVIAYLDTVFDEAEGAMVQSNAETSLLMTPLAVFDNWYVSFIVKAFIQNGVLRDIADKPEDVDLQTLTFNLRDDADEIIRTVPVEISEANIDEVNTRLVREGHDPIVFERNTLSARCKISNLNLFILQAILINLEKTEPEVASLVSLNNTLRLSSLQETLYPGVTSADSDGRLDLASRTAFHLVSSFFSYKKDVPVITSSETYPVRFSKLDIEPIFSFVGITAPVVLNPGISHRDESLILTTRPQATSFAERTNISESILYLEGLVLAAESVAADIVYIQIQKQEPNTGVFEHDTAPDSEMLIRDPNGITRLSDKAYYNLFAGDDTTSESTLSKILNSTDTITLTSASGEVVQVNSLDDINDKVIKPTFTGGSEIPWTSVALTESNNALQAGFGEILQSGPVPNFIELQISELNTSVLRATVIALNLVKSDDSGQSYLVVQSDPFISTSAQAINDSEPLKDDYGMSHDALPANHNGHEYGLFNDSNDNKMKLKVPFNDTSLLNPDVMEKMEPFLAVVPSNMGTITRAVASFPEIDAIMNDDTESPVVKEQYELSYKFIKSYIDAVDAEIARQGVGDLLESEKIGIWDVRKREMLLVDLLEVYPTAKIKKTTKHQTLDLANTDIEFELQATVESGYILVQESQNDTESRLGVFSMEAYIKQGRSAIYPLLTTTGLIIEININLKLKSDFLSPFLIIGDNKYHVGHLEGTNLGNLNVVTLNVPKSGVDFECEYEGETVHEEKLSFGEISLGSFICLKCARGSSTEELVPYMDRAMDETIETYLNSVVDLQNLNQKNLLSPMYKVYDTTDPLSAPPAVAEDDGVAHLERRIHQYNLYSQINNLGAFSIGLANGDSSNGVFAPGPITDEELKSDSNFAISGQIPPGASHTDLFINMPSYAHGKLMSFDNMCEAGTTTTACSYGTTGTIATFSGIPEANLVNSIAVPSEQSYLQAMANNISIVGSIAWYAYATGFSDPAKGTPLSLPALNVKYILGPTSIAKTASEQIAFLAAKESTFLTGNPLATAAEIETMRTEAMALEEYTYNIDPVITAHTNELAAPNGSVGWSSSSTTPLGQPKLFSQLDFAYWNSPQAQKYYDIHLDLKIFDTGGNIVDTAKKEYNPLSGKYELTATSFYKNTQVSKTLPAGSVLFSDSTVSYGFGANTPMDIICKPSGGFYLGTPVEVQYQVISHLSLNVGPIAIQGQDIAGTFQTRRFCYPEGTKKSKILNAIPFGLSTMVTNGPLQPSLRTETNDTGVTSKLAINFQNYADIFNKGSSISLVLTTKSDELTAVPTYSIFSTNLLNGRELSLAGKFSRATQEIEMNLSGTESDKLVGIDLDPIFIDALTPSATGFLPKPDGHVGPYPQIISGLLFGNFESSGLQSSIAPLGQYVNSTRNIKHGIGIPLGSPTLIAFANPTSTSSSLV